MSVNIVVLPEAYREINKVVPIEDMARRYGLLVDRSGKKAVCPFHNDHHPSMSFWHNRFHCFSCGALGSVLDLAMKILNLDIKSAAQRLDKDFGLGLLLEQIPITPEVAVETKQIQKELDDTLLRGFEIWRQEAIKTLSKYHRELWIAKRDLAPKTPDEKYSALFVLACQKLDYVNYILETLENGSPREKVLLYKNGW